MPLICYNLYQGIWTIASTPAGRVPACPLLPLEHGCFHLKAKYICSVPTGPKKGYTSWTPICQTIRTAAVASPALCGKMEWHVSQASALGCAAWRMVHVQTRPFTCVVAAACINATCRRTRGESYGHPMGCSLAPLNAPLATNCMIINKAKCLCINKLLKIKVYTTYLYRVLKKYINNNVVWCAAIYLLIRYRVWMDGSSHASGPYLSAGPDHGFPGPKGELHIMGHLGPP